VRDVSLDCHLKFFCVIFRPYYHIFFGRCAHIDSKLSSNEPQIASLNGFTRALIFFKKPNEHLLLDKVEDAK